MDEPIVVNAKGGAQSALTIAPRLIPPEALRRLGEVVAYGAGKYAENNWRRIPFEDHINHAMAHLIELMDGDTSDDHLGHALCRLAMATATETKFDFKAYRPLPEPAAPPRPAKRATLRKKTGLKRKRAAKNAA